MELFIDTFYENASPLRWEQNEDGVVDLYLAPDHERFSSNRQVTHWNFTIEVSPEDVGRQVRLRFRAVSGCWSGHPNMNFTGGRMMSAVSGDGRNWEIQASEPAEGVQDYTELVVALGSPRTQVAHLVPYTDTLLQRSLEELSTGRDVRIYPLGCTVERRPLEMVEIGREDAPHRILLRGRAHPWETGGSWLLEGLMRHLALDPGPEAEDLRRRLCFCILPMANKDGVYRGLCRFNVRGADLNRGWTGDGFSAELAPENACLRHWLAAQQGMRRPELAICLHNDDNGPLIFANTDDPGYRQRMELFERLLRENSWFTEGSLGLGKVPSDTFADGLLNLYGIDAMVYELKALEVEGLGGRPATHLDWMEQGRNLARTLDKYFAVL